MGLIQIRRKLYFLAAASSGCLLALFTLAQYEGIPIFYKKVLLGLLLSTLLLLVFLSVQEYKNLKMAELIVENQIMYIQPAVIDSGISRPGGPLSAGVIEVFISCFGILFGSQIIKFNLDRIHLKSVEIGHNHVSFTYGTKFSTKKISILHGALDGRELENIVEKFRFETGIIPVVESGNR